MQLHLNFYPRSLTSGFLSYLSQEVGLPASSQAKSENYNFQHPLRRGGAGA